MKIEPQPGPQTAFLSSKADICIYGGSAGAGKTFALEMEPMRHLSVKNFTAVLLRRTSKQITKAGGPWDESLNLYPHVGGKPKSSVLEWHFPAGSKVAMGHIEYEKDLQAWDGSQIALLLFDQLESFTERMFFYMLSRNRSACGVRPYVRATCNPDASSWLKGFILWWLDQDTGFPIKERSGVLRWLVRYGRKLNWFDTKAEAKVFCQENDIDVSAPKSVTFIPATLDDNKILMEKDPGYKSNLQAMSKYDRNRLLGGNWNERPEGGEFDIEWVNNKWFEKWPVNYVAKTMILDPSKGPKDNKTGGKKNKQCDYQSYVKLLIGSDDILYVQGDLKRQSISQMIADGVDHYQGFKPEAFGMESNAWQDLLKPDFEEEFSRQDVLVPEIWLMNNSVNKHVRIRRLAGWLANDRVRFMKDCPGTQLLIDQLLDFPNGDHDDGPDAMEMAIRLAEQLLTGPA